MKRVLLLQDQIPHYRIPVFNMLNKEVDLTVVYSKGSVPDTAEFQTKKIEMIGFHGYKCYKASLRRLLKNFDTLIAPFDFGRMDVLALLKKKQRKIDIILWGIGVPASYDVRYDSTSEYDHKWLSLINAADRVLFYSDYPIQKYIKLGVSAEKMYVAQNTVLVNQTEFSETRNSFLFVGSLYKQKKIMELLEQYYEAYHEENSMPILNIIGEGEEFDRLQCYIDEKKLYGKVHLIGGIYDEEKLEKYFSSALLCISPDQAGLSVLKSMGYGVTFVTMKNAITGGEIFNIENDKTGILLNDLSELKGVMVDAVKNPEKYIKIGYNAYRHYHENRAVSNMVKGFIDAIYSSAKKGDMK